MRIAFRSYRLSVAAALCAALLPLSAMAQQVSGPDEASVSPTVFVADAAWMKHFVPLDEDTLDQQRGRAAGMVMVAATPQMLGTTGNSVTLWDEIAPPTPMPIPVDAQRAMQSNTTSYTRQ